MPNYRSVFGNETIGDKIQKALDMSTENLQREPVFEKQEKAGINSQGHYQFGSNCCIGCKVDRPMNEQGLWCEGCKNYQYSK